MTIIKNVVIAIIGIWVGFNGFRYYEANQIQQPYDFNHSSHRIMDCIVCHTGAVDNIRAVLPSFNVCTKCHASSPLIDEHSISIWNNATESGMIIWKKMTSVPEHVFFSHRRHTKIGKLNCSNCHGEMQNYVKPPALPLIRISMDLCIDCHKEKEISEDCARCHK